MADKPTVESPAESKRTKGKWRMESYGRNGARLVCVEPLAEQVIGYTSGRVTQEEAEANALMWAAAPELYELVIELLHDYEPVSNFGRQLVARADALLAVLENDEEVDKA